MAFNATRIAVQKEIGVNRYRMIREKYDLSRAGIAKLIACSPYTIWAWEHNKRSPSRAYRCLYDMLDSGFLIPRHIVARNTIQNTETISHRRRMKKIANSLGMFDMAKLVRAQEKKPELIQLK